jgi:ligand-binding sensor domain-containing protein
VGTSDGTCVFRDDAIRVLDTRDGVPQRNSQAIWEDTDGSIWIAAGRSLVRQEGAGFRAVEIPTSSPVLDLDVAPDGALWLGTQDRGVLRIDEDGSTTKYTTQSGLRSNQTTVLHVDPEGDVWVGIAYEGLARIRASGEVEAIGAVPGSLVYDIQPDRRGGLWFATDAGITRYDPWVPYQFVSEYRTYFQQHYGRDFFVGTFGDGLYHLHDGQVEHYTSQDGLSGNDIVVMHVGRDSVLWIGTESGVSRYADGALAPLHTGTRLDTTHVWGLLEGADGRLWLTTPEGLFCYDGLGVRHLTTADGLASDRVSWRLFEDRDGGIWVTYERFGQSAFGTTAVTRLSAGEARSYSIPRRPLAILQDRQGTVWLGTDAGLFRHTAWGLEPVVLPGGTRANSIRGIIEGSGSLWLATNAGLTHYDGSTSRRYTVRDGLTSDVMSGNPTRDRRRQHLVADLDRRHGHRRRGLPALHHTRWTPR